MPYPTWIRTLVTGGALLALGTACARPEPPPTPLASPDTERETALGSVIGFEAENGAHVWRGLPFAQPPVAALRWRAPQPPEPWTEMREALEFGPACTQFAGPMGASDGAKAGSVTGAEDCLLLNVFAPPFAHDAIPQAEARLPVLVWIHGGGNTIGDAKVYDASALAISQQVVVVTIQYRLGVFGWFSHPALRAAGTDDDDASGNYGTLDITQSLAWVRDHIAAFGGDPGRVTVFGESAGGRNTASMLLSPRASGLFHGAIVQSGSFGTTERAEAENYRDAPEPGDEKSSREVVLALLIADGRATDRDTAKEIADAMDPAEVDTYLRGKTSAQVLAAFEGDRLGGMYRTPQLIRDGVVLPLAEPLESLASPDGYNRVPVILGTNRDENKLFLMFGSDFVTTLFGLPLWISDEKGYDATAEYSSAMWKASAVDEPAAVLAKTLGERGNVYGYRFDWDEEPQLLWLDFAKLLGACHALEIPFVFGRLDLGPANRFLFDESRRPAAEALSEAMMSYWGNFAYTGDPGRGRDGSLPTWSAWEGADGGQSGQFVVFDTDADGGLRMSPDVVSKDLLLARAETDARFDTRMERCALYHGFVQWSRRMSVEEYETIGDGACSAYPIDEFPWES